MMIGKKIAKKIRVRIGVRDILEGEPCRAMSCPLALALQRRGFLNVHVLSAIATMSDWDAATGDSEASYLAELPIGVRNFISKFDLFGHSMGGASIRRDRLLHIRPIRVMLTLHPV